MNNEWHEGTEGLAKFLIEDPERRADVVYVDDGLEFDACAEWDEPTLGVASNVPYACDIIRWRPKHEPIVLTGEAEVVRMAVSIVVPLDVEPGTRFTYTLTEVP